MNLDDAQRTKVVEWIAQGLKLSDIQNRLVSELGVTMTYMEVRFLVDDLKLTPKDPEPAKPISSPLAAPAAPPAKGGQSPADRPGAEPPMPAPTPGGPGAQPSGCRNLRSESTVPRIPRARHPPCRGSLQAALRGRSG